MTNPRPLHNSRQASDVQIERRASPCPAMLMSARMPRIVSLPLLGRAAFPDHGQETLVSRIELGLKFGRVAPSVTRQDALIGFRHLVPVLLDVSDRGVDLPRADAE